ncbi:MAG: alpha/beta hydrolase [Paracoccus sp. (in: a-proteobacteria)]|uniref:alpha/beta fold hydrolase n=1 Tax=Paracoccus sp. TaxID=267 RepID=UPI0026DEA21E|nr:alpha/beta hydrolase [Paracoccus sp. (in: a-proteobacteria)]MDO5613406.1 alpha/beta hydrolase [Paracoccus sp. (in: a-proteobacteria)]
MTLYFHANDGTRLAYSDQGQGLPILCLAGLTRTMADFDWVAPHLADCRMIRMDYRGRGQSQWTGADSYNVPREAQDAFQLMDHLGVEKAAILGTSRGGMVGIVMAAMNKARLLGICLNDVGPELNRLGLDRIIDYVGRNPSAKSYESMANRMSRAIPGFRNVPEGRWLGDAHRHYQMTPEGMKINYDPELRDAFIAGFAGESPSLWPLFDLCDGLPMALIRGANSDLLSVESVDKMRNRRPDMLFTQVPDRAHVPWLDEPEAVAVIREWVGQMQQG